MTRATFKRTFADGEFAVVGVIGVLLFAAATMACGRTRAADHTSAPPVSTASTPPRPDAATELAEASAPAVDAPTTRAVDTPAAVEASPVDAATDGSPWSPPPFARIDGPHEDLSLEPGRPIYYALRRERSRPLRLVGHLHGVCAPPAYACGRWLGAGTEVGMMVCPTGNARCGDSPVGPASWEARSWPELVAIMDKDLESAAAKVEAKRPGSIRKDGAVLTGYSRGAFAAPVIAQRHPNRWPYLVLIEANVTLSAESLVAAGVRAVALVAGELGTEISGMTNTQRELERAGLPARLFVMRRTGHPYSDDMEYVMHDALTFVLSHEPAIP